MATGEGRLRRSQRFEAGLSGGAQRDPPPEVLPCTAFVVQGVPVDQVSRHDPVEAERGDSHRRVSTRDRGGLHLTDSAGKRTSITGATTELKTDVRL